MRWYVSDDLAELRGKDPNSRYRAKWCEAWKVNPEYGEPLTCPQCGGPITPLQWIEPRKIRLTSSKYPDRISYYLKPYLVVSDRFKKAYTNSGLSGIREFIPLETVKVARNRDPLTYPTYYIAEVDFTTAVREDYEQSKIYGQPYDWKCPLCNPRGATRDRVEKIVLYEVGPANDFVRIFGLGLAMSQRAYDFITEHGFTNFNLVDVSEYQFGMNTGPGPDEKQQLIEFQICNDTTDTWIVFRKTHDMVTVSVEDKWEDTMSEYTCFSDGSYYRDTFITEPNIPMVQRSGAVCEVPLEMVVSKIVSAAQLCQQDFLRINAALVNSRMYRQLSSKLSMIEI